MRPVLFASALAACALAQASDLSPLPKDLPPYAAEKPVPVPEIARRTLPNGLTVWVVPREGMPKVNIIVATLGGTAQDDAKTPAISDLLADLLGEGTPSKSSREIAEAFQGIGGEFAASTGPDAIRATASALASHADQLVALTADNVLHPAFPDNEVALAKTNALQALKASEADPNWQAERAFSQTIFDDHPYARSVPTEASIAAATPALLRAEYAKRFRPDRSLVVIAGRITPERGFSLVEKSFGDWKATGDAPAATPTAPKQTAPKRVIVARENSVQSNIRYGRPAVPASDPDYVPLTVANVILGGSFHSRLVRDIREEKGYSYSPGSTATLQRVGGRIQARADVRNDVTGATIDELDKLFAGMATQAATEEELTGAKRFVAGIYLLRNQQQAALAGTLATYWVNGLPPEFFGTYVDKAKAVSAEDVQLLGKKYYGPKDQSIVVVGDAKAIGEQLKAHGEFKPAAK